MMKTRLKFLPESVCRLLTGGLLLLLLLTGYVKATAQIPPAGRQDHITVATPDTGAIMKMIRLSVCVTPADKDFGARLLATALKRSRETGFSKGVFIVFDKLGYRAQFEGDHAAALGFYLQILPYMASPEVSRYGNILYNNIGKCYSNLGKYERAFDFYYLALRELGKKDVVHNVTDSIGVYMNIGVLWARMEEYTQALEIFEFAGAMARTKQDTAMAIDIYENIGQIYSRQKKWALSEACYQKTLAMSRKKSLYDTEAFALSALAFIYGEQQYYETALAYAQQALSLAGSKRLSAYATLDARAAMGSVYLHMKAYSKAKPLLIAALHEARKMNQQELLQLLEPRVARVLAATGSYREAYEQLQQYAKIRDSLFTKEKARSLEAWMNARMAEKDKNMLSQQLFIARQKKQLQQKNFWIAASVPAAVLLLSVIFLLVRSYRHRQAAQQSIINQLRQQQEISQLKAQVRGEEQERQRIASELHDGIASQLWAIRLNVDNMQQMVRNDQQQEKKLAAIFQQLTDATQDVRKTAHNLMPDLLLEEGLVTALASFCEKTGKHAKFEVDFQEYGPVPRLDKEIELSVYRMVQELVQNVMKHARDAGYLLVQLSCAGTLLNITVEDNGTFFNPEAGGNGVGLLQIRKRTSALKGLFDLQHVPGKGTTAYLEFDLKYLI